MAETKRTTAGGRVARRLLFLLTWIIGASSVGGQEKSARVASSTPIAMCKKNPVGFRAPDIKTPQDAANALSSKATFAPWWIYRNTISPLFTALKRVGFRGWTDYCSEACATGTVVHAVTGIDGLYTVDIALSGFQVNGEPTDLEGPRFIRIEFYGRAKKQTKKLPRKGDTARFCGKLMWDGDGFLEIHPRSAADLETRVEESPRSRSN